MGAGGAAKEPGGVEMEVWGNREEKSVGSEGAGEGLRMGVGGSISTFCASGFGSGFGSGGVGQPPMTPSSLIAPGVVGREVKWA